MQNDRHFASFLIYRLLDSSFVECLGIFCSILQVFLIGAGKIVGAAEILLGAHIEILVLYMVEYGINAGNRWNADWARRKTWILVGVVWTLDVQEVVVDTLQFETLPGELDGWVSLQWHTFRTHHRQARRGAEQETDARQHRNQEGTHR